MNVNFVVGEVPEHVSALCRPTDKKWQPRIEWQHNAATRGKQCQQLQETQSQMKQLDTDHAVRKGPVTQGCLNNMAPV